MSLDFHPTELRAGDGFGGVYTVTEIERGSWSAFYLHAGAILALTSPDGGPHASQAEAARACILHARLPKTGIVPAAAMRNYIVEPGGIIREEPDILLWAAWYEGSADQPFESGGRIVGRDKLANSVLVSTVFLGIDHSFHGGSPIIFETMIFGGEHDEMQDRYATVEAAREGHADAVKLAEAGAGEPSIVNAPGLGSESGGS